MARIKGFSKEYVDKFSALLKPQLEKLNCNPKKI